MNTMKVKSENWSGEEKAAMASVFLENFPIINGKFSSTVTAKTKKHAWEEVVKRCFFTRIFFNTSKLKTGEILLVKAQSVNKDLDLHCLLNALEIKYS